MSVNLPLTWLDKKNSPELEAFLKQYGDQYCMKAEEINQLRDAVNEMAVIQQSTFLGAAEPTYIPAGSGRAYWIAIKPGPYPNHGGVIVSVNSFAVISRDALGSFSISQTEMDLTTYQKIVDGNKINPWTAKAYLSGDQVNYLGKDWTSNAATVAGDVPGTSSKWVDRLDSYVDIAYINKKFIQELSTDPKSVTVEENKNSNSIWQNGLTSISFNNTPPINYVFTSLNSANYRKNHTLVDASLNFNYIGYALEVSPILNASTGNFTLTMPPNASLIAGTVFKWRVEIFSETAFGNQNFNLYNGSFGILKTATNFPFVANQVNIIEIESTMIDSRTTSFGFNPRYSIFNGKDFKIGKVEIVINVTSIVTKSFLNQSEKTLLDQININKEDIQNFKNKFPTGIVDYKRKLPAENFNLYTAYENVSDIGSVTALTNPKLYPAIIDTNKLNPLFRYSSPMRYKDLYPYIFAEQDTVRALGFMVEFFADTRWIEFRLGPGDRINVIIDNVIVTNKTFTTATSDRRFFRIDCRTKAIRHIKASIYNRFGGVNVDADGQVTQFIETKPLLVVEGDSIMEGTTATTSEMWLKSRGGIIAQILNFDLINSAVGGSGYIRNGNQGEPNMVNRFDNYVFNYNPNIFIASGGLNDGYKTTDGDEATYLLRVKTAIRNYWTNAKIKMPNTYIIIFSLYNPVATMSSTNLSINGYLKQIAKELRLPFVDSTTMNVYDSFHNVIFSKNIGVITGTGKEGSLSNPLDGNRSFYISSDNTHPTIEGLRFTGIWESNALYFLLKNDFGYSFDNVIFRE